MPARRMLFLATFAAAALLAGGAGVWLVNAYEAAGADAGQKAGAKVGAPFRSADFGQSRVTLVSATEGGNLAPVHGSDAADISRLLNERGFSEIRNLRQRGGTFICEATGPRGERVRLVVDSASGEVSGIQVIGFTDPRP